MAAETGQEKTLEPTQKKIEEAQERGEFARSREITTVVIFFMMLVFLAMGQRYLVQNMMHTSSSFLRFDSLMNLSADSVTDFFWIVLFHTLPILLPVFALVFFAGLSAEVGQIGVRVVKDPLEPKWDRLNPMTGLRRIFSLRQFVEGLKAALKLLIFVLVAYLTIRQAMPRLTVLTQNTPMQGAHAMLSVALKLGFRACAVLFLFAGFDYLFQYWQYHKKLRMTFQEVKDEQKEREGDPVVKARIRSLQMEIARKRMMKAVPDSDVVVTNPTRYAVALKYDPVRNAAPVVVAKGQNYLAQKIREVALKHNVPMVENPPLARALYRKAHIGSVIPAELFKAVAQILASIWGLAKRRGRSWALKA
jgi:flagellar biosynthetic protein FlhB